MDISKVEPGQRWRYHYPQYPSTNPDMISLVEVVSYVSGSTFKCRTLFDGLERLDREDEWDFRDHYDKNWELLTGQEAP